MSFCRIAFLCLRLAARPTRGRARIEHHCGAPGIIQRGQNVLQPAPVGRRRRWNTALKPLPLVVLIERFAVVVLIPHRVCNDVIEPLEPSAFSRESRLCKGIPDGEERIGVVVEEHVHLRHCEGDRVHLLPVQAWSLALVPGFFCSKRSRALISSPADPHVGSYTVVYGFGSSRCAISQPTSFGV